MLDPRGTLVQTERAWVIGCLLAAVVLLIVLFFTSRTAIAGGLAAHANPAPGRVPAGAG